MSALSDELDSLASTPRRSCDFREWRNSLEPADAESVERALKSKKSAREIAIAITKHGYSVSTSTIRNHRVGMCRTCQG